MIKKKTNIEKICLMMAKDVSGDYFPFRLSWLIKSYA